MSLLFYVGKRREVIKTFAGAKVQQKNEICKKKQKKVHSGCYPPHRR